jgi:hypothetical protein
MEHGCRSVSERGNPLRPLMCICRQIKRERETRSMGPMSGAPWETVTLTTLSRDRTLFTRLLAEARDLAMRDQVGKIVIYTSWGTEWKPFGKPRPKRPLHSVVLDNGVSERIHEDVLAFLKRRQWYADRGLSSLFLKQRLATTPHFRHSISSWIPAAWSSRLRKVIVHSSLSGVARLRHLPSQSIRERACR